jgi:hypothetical protein
VSRSVRVKIDPSALRPSIRYTVAAISRREVRVHENPRIRLGVALRSVRRRLPRKGKSTTR